jgi:hypothetical protein
MALDQLRESLKTKGTVTTIPKPLKFIRSHYENLTKFYSSLENNNKIPFANILSLIAMIAQNDGSRDCLNFKLQGNLDDISEYGHEYLRYPFSDFNFSSIDIYLVNLVKNIKKDLKTKTLTTKTISKTYNL